MYDFIFKKFDFLWLTILLAFLAVPAKADGSSLSTGSLLLIFILLGAYFVCNVLLCLAIANCNCTKKLIRGFCKGWRWIFSKFECIFKLCGCKKKRSRRVHLNPFGNSGDLNNSDLSTSSQTQNNTVVLYVIENYFSHTVNSSMHNDTTLDSSVAGLNAEDVLCIICMEKKKEVLFQPCKHICLCYPCSLDLFKNTNLCPLCRLAIKRIEPSLH